MSPQGIILTLSVALAILFGFTVFAIPVGIGAFLFFNVLFFTAYFSSRYFKTSGMNQGNLEKDELSEKPVETIITIFSIIYVLLTVVYLYRLDAIAIVPTVLFHLIFIVYYSVFRLAPKLLVLLNPLTLIVGSLFGAIQWLVSGIQSLGLLFTGGATKIKSIGKIIVYALVSLVIFIFFAVLLSQADTQFAAIINDFFYNIRIGEILMRAIVTTLSFVMAYSFFAVLLGKNVSDIVGLTKDTLKGLTEKLKNKGLINFSETIFSLVILVPVTLLFGLFVFVQFKYLFVQKVSDLMIISEYARKGFWELLAVTAFAYPLVAWVTNRSQSVNKAFRYASFVVTSITTLLVGIVLYSAFYRMNLYVDVYGPSLYRVYVLICLGVIALLFLSYLFVSFLKTIKPGMAYVKSLFFGDFIVMGTLSMAFLLMIITLVPWNSIVFGQIKSQYAQSNEIDVFALRPYLNEASAQITQFAEMEKSDLPVASAALKQLVYSAQQLEDDELDSGNLGKIFGPNVARISLAANALTDDQAKQNSDLLQREFDNVVISYLNALESNDFPTARLFMDKKTKANSLNAFAAGRYIRFDKNPKNFQRYPQVSDLFSANSSSQFVEYSVPVKSVWGSVNRLSEDRYVSDYFNVSVGMRDGKPVVRNSSIALGNIPESLESDSEPDAYYDVSQYGFNTLCLDSYSEKYDRNNCELGQINRWFYPSDFIVD